MHALGLDAFNEVKKYIFFLQYSIHINLIFCYLILIKCNLKNIEILYCLYLHCIFTNAAKHIYEVKSSLYFKVKCKV